MSAPWPVVPLLLAAVFAGCNSDGTPPGEPGAPTGAPETINGRERLGWLQEAADASELATFDFAIYIDGTRRVLQDAACGANSGPTGFECSAALPPIPAGRHTLQIATVELVAGQAVESSRSAPLEVNVVAAASPATTAARTDPPPSPPTSANPRLRADVLARGLREPTDLAVAGGAIFVAERRGRILRAADGGLDEALTLPAVVTEGTAGLLSVAVPPDVDVSRLLYAAYTVRTSGGDAVRVVRLREVGGRLGEAATILDAPIDALDASVVIRVGPDGRVYVALGAGAESDRAQQASSLHGKILRLNPDGTTPRDNPRASPVLSAGHRQPRALAWDPAGTLWSIDPDEQGDELNRITGGGNYGWPLARSLSSSPPFTRPVLTLGVGTDVAGAVFGPPRTPLAGALLVTSRGTPALLVLRTSAGVPTIEALMQEQFGRLGRMAATDADVYVLTANSGPSGGEDALVRITIDRPRRP